MTEVTVTQITTQYNQGPQKTTSDLTVLGTLKKMGSSSRPHGVALLSAKNRNASLRSAQNIRNWTVEDWKNWSESRFQLQHSKGSSRIWCKQHESVDPSCLVPSEHPLNLNYLSVAADQVPPLMTIHSGPSPGGYLQQDITQCHRAQIISNWSLDKDIHCTPVASSHQISIQWSPFGMPVTLAYRNISRSICACYRLQLETFESLFLARHELQPHCVPVCSTQEISRILQRSFTISTSHPCHECCCHSGTTEHTH